MITCPDCGAEHYPGTLFCDQCGAAVHPAARAHVQTTRKPGRPAPERKPPPAPLPAAPAVPAASPPALLVRLPAHDAEITLTGGLFDVGRADPDDDYTPELDLTAYGGQERGVSRRHATIRWIEGGYVLVDQHSSNGTWLNGVRLVPGYAYQIPPGANVRFGGLLVQLSPPD